MSSRKLSILTKSDLVLLVPFLQLQFELVWFVLFWLGWVGWPCCLHQGSHPSDFICLCVSEQLLLPWWCADIIMSLLFDCCHQCGGVVEYFTDQLVSSLVFIRWAVSIIYWSVSIFYHGCSLWLGQWGQAGWLNTGPLLHSGHVAYTMNISCGLLQWKQNGGYNWEDQVIRITFRTLYKCN